MNATQPSVAFTTITGKASLLLPSPFRSPPGTFPRGRSASSPAYHVVADVSRPMRPAPGRRSRARRAWWGGGWGGRAAPPARGGGVRPTGSARAGGRTGKRLATPVGVAGGGGGGGAAPGPGAGRGDEAGDRHGRREP